MADHEVPYTFEGPLMNEIRDFYASKGKDLVLHNEKDLVSAVSEFYISKGVALMKQSANKRCIPLHCSRGGHERPSSGTGQRDRISKKTGCMFRVTLSKKLKKRAWEVVVSTEEHNHDLIVYGDAIAKRLTPNELEFAMKKHQEGMGFQCISHELAVHHGKVHVDTKSVTNAVIAETRRQSNGKSDIQLLSEDLLRNQYNVEDRTDLQGRVSGLMIIHPNSLKLVRRFNTVLVMDCTYKTNRYNMPLLNVVGITSTYQTFNAGFAFLSSEKQDTYKWALKKFKKHWRVDPKVIATDCEAALMTAIRDTFPKQKTLFARGM